MHFGWIFFVKSINGNNIKFFAPSFLHLIGLSFEELFFFVMAECIEISRQDSFRSNEYTSDAYHMF